MVMGWKFWGREDHKPCDHHFHFVLDDRGKMFYRCACGETRDLSGVPTLTRDPAVTGAPHKAQG